MMGAVLGPFCYLEVRSMSARLPGDALNEWRRHWPVALAGCVAVASSTMNAYSTGLFVDPLQTAFGWSRAEIMTGQAFAAISSVLLGPIVGIAIDRFGPRRIGISGISSLCILTAALGATGPSIWSWWAIWLLLALVNPFIQPTVWTAAASGLFSAGRGTALAVMLCGSGLGSLFIPVLTYELIDRIGWRFAFPAMAAIIAGIALPVILLFFTSVRDQERKGQREIRPSRRPAERAVWRLLLTPRFVQLFVAAFLIAAVIVPIVVNIVPILTWNGLHRGQAAGVAAILGISSILGRLLIGFLLDRVEGRFLAAVSVLLPIGSISLLLLVPGSLPAASAAALILGFALGAEYDIVAYLVSRYFSVEHFGLFFGTVAGAVTLAGGGGPAVVSAVYDSTGSYGPALLATIPMCGVSALLFVLLGPYPRLTTAS